MRRRRTGNPGFSLIRPVPHAPGKPSLAPFDWQLAVRRYQTIQTGTCLIAISSGTVYVVTDNDGVDDSTGETQFRNLGKALD